MKYLFLTQNNKPPSYTLKNVVTQRTFLYVDVSIVTKRERKPKGYSRMDNPETQVAVDTRHITNTNKSKQYTTQKITKMSNTDLTRQHMMNPCVRQW